MTAYSNELDENLETVAGDFELWGQSMCANRPCFMYWGMVLDIELSILTFIRSLREGNFD